MNSSTKDQNTSSCVLNQSNLQIIWKSPTELIPHPLNTKIYGENEDIEELVEAIRKSDWIKAIVITPENRIISGHRRVAAAIALGREKVEVQIRHFDSELDEKEALLLENQYRQKTTEQQVREGQQWEQIERERARQRQSQGAKLTNQKKGRGKKETLQANLPEASLGQTRDKVAAQVGMKGRNYQKAKKVVVHIDALADDEPNKAEELRRILNSRSVHAAYTEVQKQTKKNTIEDIKRKTAEKAGLPFPFQVGEVCQIVARRGDKKLRQYSGIWCIVDEVYDYSCKVLVFDGELQLEPENLKSCDYTNSECRQSQAIMQRIRRLQSLPDADPAIEDIVQGISRRITSSLSPMQEKLLSFLEEQYGLN